MPEFAKSKGWEVFDIYIDKGISGATIEARSEFKRLLEDMIDRSFNVLLVEFQDRITRTENLQERGLILQMIKDNNITLWSPSEGPSDLSEFAGEITSTIKFIISAEERKRIRERTLKGKKAKLDNGVASSVGGKMPFARIFDKKTGEWSLDKEKADLIRWTADQYLKGESLRAIAHTLTTKYSLKIGYHNLLKTLSKRSGDSWSIKFKDGKTVDFKIPSILDDDTIRAINDRITFNKRFNRKDVKKYVLNGFLRCGKCHRALNGQQQSKGKYLYYRHPTYSKGQKDECKAFTSISASKIENAVFITIFENIYDEVGFQKAIKDSLPDVEYIKFLKERIVKSEKELKQVERKLDKLVDMVLKGALEEETVKKKEAELLDAKNSIKNALEADNLKINSLPSLERTQREAESIRIGLMDYFGSKEVFLTMPYEHKREFLHWLFDGVDEDGDRLGIYIEKRGEMWDYEISAKMMRGTRTIFGNDIDYQGEEKKYKTNGVRSDTGDAAERLQGCCKGRHETIQNPPGRA